MIGLEYCVHWHDVCAYMVDECTECWILLYILYNNNNNVIERMCTIER